jgi:hypothetical protein
MVGAVLTMGLDGYSSARSVDLWCKSESIKGSAGRDFTLAVPLSAMAQTCSHKLSRNTMLDFRFGISVNLAPLLIKRKRKPILFSPPVS